MELSTLISVLPFITQKGELDGIEVRSIETDSRKVKPGSLFVCIRGFNTDGHLYVEEAARNGAAAIVSEQDISAGVPVIYVNDSVRALSMLANKFFGYPSSKINLIGVTGTNGKTTVTYLLNSIFEHAGRGTGVIGTIQIKIGDSYRPTNNTTPDALVLQSLFHEMTTLGVEQAIMEVSSHALDLGRTYGCDFDTVIYTNLTQDHLDYHQTEENYFQAKSLLFSQLGNSYGGRPKFACINGDDRYAARLAKMTAQPVITYGIENQADVMATDIRLFANQVFFRLKTPVGTVKITSRLTGKFNIYNMLAASTAALVNGIPLEIIQHTFQKLSPVPGRYEVIDCGQPFGVIVDYAHTPDALQNILKTSRELTTGNLYCVVGCGGDRDAGKRPLMAREAVTLADQAIFTSDNPRTEKPESILEDMVEGLDGSLVNYEVIVDRKSAIEKAITSAKEGDLVVIAGKGHETYQEINGIKHPFDDRDVAREAIIHKGF